MLKTCSLLIGSLGLLLTVSPSPTLAAGMEAKEAVELLEAALQSIKSYDLRLEVKRFSHLDREYAKVDGHVTVVKSTKRSAPVLLGHHYYRQAFQRGKGRIEILDGPEGKPTRLVVYDGEVEKSFDRQGGTCILRKQATTYLPDGHDYLESHCSFHGRFSLFRPLRDRKNVIMKRQGPDNALIVLETEPVARGGNIDLPDWGFRVTADSRRNFMPIMMETFHQVRGKTFVARRTTVDETKDFGGGVRVPTKFTTQFFDQADRGTFGVLASEDVAVVDLARSTWNKAIPEERFQLALPAGTRVTDRMRGVEYVTGEPDPGKNLDDLAAIARNLVPLPPITPAATPANWTLRLSILGACLAVAGLAGGMLLYARRRRREGGT